MKSELEETALDVLSRAACMLQRNQNGFGYTASEDEVVTSSDRGSVDRGSSPCSNPAQTDDMSVDIDLNISVRKCTGTQTSFSSFDPTKVDPDWSRMAGNESFMSCGQESCTTDWPASFYTKTKHLVLERTTNKCNNPHSVTTWEMNNHCHGATPKRESCNSPLNLTVSPSPRSTESSPQSTDQSSRSSLGSELACSNTVGDQPVGFCSWLTTGRQAQIKVEDHFNRSFLKLGRAKSFERDSKPYFNGGSTRFMKQKSVEYDIEEHFKRSLGKDYMAWLLSKASGNHGNPSHIDDSGNHAIQNTHGGKTANVSVTGSVDDHFSKSLGSTWTKLKSTYESQIDFDIRPSSVDDHFAKALGETWFRIKAQQENS